MPKSAGTRRLTVCLFSPHPLVLEEFRRVLSLPDFRLQPRRQESSLSPDLRRLPVPRAQAYVVDGHAPRPVVEALVAGILDRFARARVLVLAEGFSEASAFPLLCLGVKGFLSYAEARQRLPEALKVVAGGGFWVPRSWLSRFVDSLLSSAGTRRLVSGASDLSRRQREVLEALVENLSNKEIASRLNICERTVKFHVSELLARFGARRRTDLILSCLQAQPAAPTPSAGPVVVPVPKLAS